VAWLISNNVDISCLTIKPYEINDEMYLKVARILPPPAIEDYFVGVKSSSKAANSGIKTRVTRSILPKMDKLFEWGVIKAGDDLVIKNREANKGVAIDSKYVDSDGTKLTYHEWCKLATGWSSVQTYAMIIKKESNKTLSELRNSKMKELELVEND